MIDTLIYIMMTLMPLFKVIALGFVIAGIASLLAVVFL